ncbi:retrovirus-related pol polyprotein from transposon opus [Plakobranchus ocellatus]|uniref:Retrovirus-related pol polyprotein from transposon opus n=1 Tax=Plakobranchus ocellatus TaxID=259542 RepID=A0AAV4BY66_9GAST|nr:retrovirus-related pol polyprotein from transposon opus [Plakobranchus ocellatus]
MPGPPMRLIIDDDATPVAHHTPIPVPIHWQEQVKAGLDMEVRLGVIEPVPIGTPVYGVIEWSFAQRNPTASSRRQSGWTCVAEMVSSSTLRNSPLPKKLSISQALKSPPQPFAHAHKFWRRSKDSPNPAPSLMYAPIEGEALAVVDALEKIRHFVLGCPNRIIAVDHRPLLKVFGDRSLEAIPNPRLRNLKEKTLKYRFHITHIPGIRHVAADTISRNPVGAANHLSLPDDANLVSTDKTSSRPYLIASLRLSEYSQIYLHCASVKKTP